jgi:penicillin-insensitive murein endopeptidase
MSQDENPTHVRGAIALAVALIVHAGLVWGADDHAPGVVDRGADVPGLEAGLATALPDAAETLLVLAQRDPSAVGPLSIGPPDSGLLVNPLPMREGPYWTVRDASESWATDETIDFIVSAIETVEGRFPGSPRLVIGDLSHPGGGRLNRHRSHQTGRDADIGFYYREGEASSFRPARKGDLDLPRSWAFVRALITETDIERIFVDRSIMRLLYEQARAEGEDPDWLDDVFGRRGDDHKGIIQHVRRHKDHMHVRFFNPRAQEHGRIVYPVLVEAGVVPPPTVKHRVRRGETLGHLARRYGTSVSAIRAANRLRGSRLRAGRSYVIPVRRIPPDPGPFAPPARRLPPPLEAPVASSAAAQSDLPVSVDSPSPAAQR